MTLGERIALARKRAGLSQEQLGEKLGVSRQAVSKWESDQTNPDVAYVAQMCRLLGVSSDWLLLGEESAQLAAPERCPGCQYIVSGLDQYCPSCGQFLRGKPEGYTILLKALRLTASPPVRDLVCLSNTGLFPEGSPLASPLTEEEAERLAHSGPLVLAKGLSKKQMISAWDATIFPNCFLFFQDSEEENPELLAANPGIDPGRLLDDSPREPLSFGRMILAVILGVMGAFLLLPILINLIAAFLGPLL